MTMNFFDGRGRWSRYPTRNTVSDSLRLDAQAIGRKGLDRYRRFTWR